MPSDKKCEAIEHKNIVPSWACCSCRTLNGNHRDVCKYCSHARCFYPEIVIKSTIDENAELPISFASAIDKKLLN